jgi:hypothetical protein
MRARWNAPLILATLIFGSLASPAPAQPDLRRPLAAAALTLFPDDRRPDLFYYTPGDLALGSDAAGHPDIRLLEMRYYGTGADGHPGLIHFRALLSFRVEMAGPGHDELESALAELEAQHGRVELRPLPIRRIEAAVVYAPIGEPGAAERPSDEGGALRDGHFEPGDSAAEGGDGFWRERVYTLRLDPFSAQALRWALENGRTLISFGYAIFADGIGPDTPLEDLSGSPELIAALSESLGAAGDSASGTSAPRGVLVHAGASAITVDAARDSGLVQSIDINEQMPPGYPVLEVRCYDFRDGLRPDLYEKAVEIEAEAVNGRTVRMTVSFGLAQPDLYVSRPRSRFALRLDRPYRYRLLEVRRDGELIEHAWQERESWAEMLDVTTPADSLDREGDPPAPAGAAVPPGAGSLKEEDQR